MKAYPSKILLFGEYSVLLNSDAIAIPFERYGGEWAFMDMSDPDCFEAESNKDLRKLLDHLKYHGNTDNQTHFPDLVRFETDINKGLYFKSDIPRGSGLGSSGALSAAVLKRYDASKTGEVNDDSIRNSLAVIESYFHGTSSGIDPLVSYTRLPVLSHGNRTSVADINPEYVISKYGIFIIKGEKLGSTGSLVKQFRSRVQADRTYYDRLSNEYIPVNNKCVNAVLENKPPIKLFSHLQDLVTLQLDLFSDMISKQFIPLIEDGITNELFALKLCGSGGGGYMLGFTLKPEETREYFENKQYKMLFC